MADHFFPTPTACGAWLRATIEQKRAHLREVEENRVLQEARGFREQVRGLEDTNRTLAENLQCEAQARRDLETQLLAHQQQILQQLEAARKREADARREGEKLRQEAEARRKEAEQKRLESESSCRKGEQHRQEAEKARVEAEGARQAMRALEGAANRLSEQLATLQATHTACQGDLDRFGRELALAIQAGKRAWRAALASVLLPALGWVLFLLSVFLTR